MTSSHTRSRPAWALLVAIAALACGARLAGQTPSEIALRKLACTRLEEHAARCDKLGAKASAQIARWEIVEEYDPDHPEVRRKLGHQRVGERWAPDLEAPAASDEIDDRARAQIDKSWRQLATELGTRHLQVAKELTASGATESAARHFRRTLRFQPGDDDAGKALGLDWIDGLWLSPVETEVLCRRRLLQQAVQQLRSTQFPVTDLSAGPPHPWVQKHLPDVAPSYRGCRGPSTEVWGNLPPEVLREALQAAERANLLLRALLGDTRGRGWQENLPPVFLFDTDASHYARAVDASANSTEVKASLKQHNGGVWLEHERRKLFFGLQNGEPEFASDDAVRCTAGHAVNTGLFTLQEGIGHACCGWLLGRSLNFFLNLAPTKPATGTSASTKTGQDLLIPSMSAWYSMAVTQAWARTDPDAEHLVRYRSDNTPAEARIKAWSLVHYLLFRDPALLAHLETGATQGGDNLAKIGAAFEKAAALPLRELEANWRSHWRTVESGPDPWSGSSARPADAERKLGAWLEAASRWRIARGLPPLGRVPGLPAACRGVLSAPGAVDAAACTQPAGAEVTDDAAWNDVLVIPSVGSQTAKTIDALLVVPGCRDLLLSPSTTVVRYGLDRDRALLGIGRQPIAATLRTPWFHPPAASTEIPASVPVAALGATAAAALGLPAGPMIGQPLSMHFGPCQPVAKVECEVATAAGPIEGRLVTPDPTLPRRLSAPGMFVFYPLTPLPAGAAIEVTWRWRTERGQPQECRVQFRTRR